MAVTVAVTTAVTRSWMYLAGYRKRDTLTITRLSRGGGVDGVTAPREEPR